MSSAKDVRQTPIPIKLDRERSLFFDMNAFIVIEEKFGTLQNAMEEFSKGTMKALRSILWIGLLHEDPTLTEENVGRIVTFKDIPAISEAIDKALDLALPGTDEDNTPVVAEGEVDASGE